MTAHTWPAGDWVILELMGHRRLAGYLTEQEIGGASFLRLDVPEDGKVLTATQFYSAAAVYSITPTTAEIARQVAKVNRPEPVRRWELPALLPPDPLDEGPDRFDEITKREDYAASVEDVG